MMTALEDLRDALALVPGIASCKIGLEANISPADYPMIRIVPSRILDAAALGRRRAEVMIYADYRDLGGGVIEITYYCYNFGRDVLNDWGLPWGGPSITGAGAACSAFPIWCWVWAWPCWAAARDCSSSIRSCFSSKLSFY
jgi:hypothetical protein